jgi:hypothetical protein
MNISNIRRGFLATYTPATDRFHRKQMVPEWIGRGGETKNPCAMRAGNRKENKACDCVDFGRQVL